MAKETGIAWTRSTRNLWAGCTKIGPGCDGCYAEAFQRWVQGKDPESGEAKNWGPGRPRTPYLLGAFKDLRSWNTSAMIERGNGVKWRDRIGFWPVFLNTQSDFFDNEAPHEWRELSYPVIEECSNLTFFLVTKRIGNVAVMVPKRWMENGFPAHVRLLITVVNQKEAERDIPKLLELPCKNGISYEPALGPIDWCAKLEYETVDWLKGMVYPHAPLAQDPPYPLERILHGRTERASLEWIIVGGESDQAGHKARPFDVGWARATIAAGRAAGVPVFVKQLGSHPIPEALPGTVYRGRIPLKDDSGSDPAEWPEDLRVQEFPR